MMWESYRLPSLARCLNASYAGGSFVDRALLIVMTFKDKYAGRRCASRDDDACVDDGDDEAAGGGTTTMEEEEEEEKEEEEEEEEVPYKLIIATLCELRTPHATAAAELVLD